MVVMERTAQHPTINVLEAYEKPLILHQEVSLLEQEEIIWWVVFIGFAYVVALAYAAYCTHSGGHPNISFGWTGFKVQCNK